MYATSMRAPAPRRPTAGPVHGRHPGSCEGDPALDAVQVETPWREWVQEMAEGEGVSQTARVDRALRQYFEGDR